MNPCSRREADDVPSLARSGPQLMALQLEHHGAGQRPCRVKRRKTRRERNSAKFGRNIAAGALEHKPGCRVHQRVLPPGWGLHCDSYAKSSPLLAIKKVSGSMPVIITQHRLSQHLGMFNKEVKSADIARLLDPQSEREMELKTSAITQDQTCFQDRGPGTGAHPPHTTGEGPQAAPTPAVGEQGSSHSETLVVETGDSQTKDPASLDEKEKVPRGGAEPNNATAATRELAQELQTHFNLTSMFPRRNLISERRQTILGILLDQHQTLPDLAALMVHNRACRGSAQGDLRSPGARGQELLLDMGSSGSRSSEWGFSGKKRRGPDLLPFRSSSPVQMAMTTGEERDKQREDLESPGTCKHFGQQSLQPTAAPAHHALLSGSALHTGTMANFVRRAAGPLPIGSQSYRGSWEAIREPRTMLERATVSFRQTRKENASERDSHRHWMPFAAGDSVNASAQELDSRSPLAEHPQYLCAHRLSPELWPVLQTQLHSQRPPLEQCASQPLHAGLRPMEEATSATQTSYDVLKSIWSPNQPRQAAEALAARVLAWPRPRARAVSWELHSEPELPAQACLLHRQGPDQDPLWPPREAWKLGPASRWCSVLGKPRDHCQKLASVQPVKPLDRYQPWDSEAASARTWDLPVARGDGGWETKFPVAGAQHLCTLQQLPMSFFPPSEALEYSCSPLPALHRHLLEESSPEAWVFPRMKLY